jgi:GNAT superfamily N-acetyltransferase
MNSKSNVLYDEKQELINSLDYRYLGPDDLEQIILLQEKVAGNLKEKGTPRFIVTRSIEYFRSHLAEPHAMYGIFTSENRLIAQSIFRISRIGAKEELLSEALPNLDENSGFSVAQGMLVDPEHQRLGLMKTMMDEWFEWCAGKGITHLAARTEASHEASKSAFIKHGFCVIDTITDPRDNARVCVLHKRLQAR